MEQDDYMRTASRMYGKSIKQRCRETGHSRATVRYDVRQAQWRLGKEAPPAFIPLGPGVTQETEVDWGAAVAII